MVMRPSRLSSARTKEKRGGGISLERCTFRVDSSTPTLRGLVLWKSSRLFSILIFKDSNLCLSTNSTLESSLVVVKTPLAINSSTISLTLEG